MAKDRSRSVGDRAGGDLDPAIAAALRARRRLFVHAGVVGWNGAAILIPGRSRSGKTSLVAALVALGAEYYSDEFALLDRNGLVHPHAIPLSIRSRDGGSAARVPVEDIGGRPGSRPLPVGFIVVTRYRSRAQWRPRPLSPALAMLALMDNTVAARRPPVRTMPILRRAVEHARAIDTDRGDARAVARSIVRWIS